MSVLTEVTRLEGAKASIKTAIENKGVNVPSGALLDGYAPYIDLIEVGGGGIPCALTVMTGAGATVTATLGDKVITATADGNGRAVLSLDEEGTWTIVATLNGETRTTTVNAHLEATATLSFFDPVLENNSWSTIAQIARSGQASKLWKIGDTKSFTFKTFTLHAQIIGFDHDDVADPAAYGRTKAGITFQFKELSGANIEFNEYENKTYPWTRSKARSTIRSWLASSTTMDPNIANNLVPVIKQYDSSRTTIGTETETVFLLSMSEFTGSKSTGANILGTQYEYYAAGNSKIKYRYNTGDAMPHWTRSLGTTETFAAWIASDGGYRSSDSFSTTCDLAVAFCV